MSTQFQGGEESVLLTLVRMTLPGLSDGDSADLTQHAYEQLERRVGDRLSVGLSDRQIDEFEELVDGDDGAACTRWLEGNVPHYPQIVAAAQAEVLAEIVQVVSKDPSTIQGHRLYEELVAPTMNDVHRIIAGGSAKADAQRGAKQLVAQIRVRIGEDGPVVRWMAAETGPPRFIAVAISQHAVCDEDRPRVQKLCDAWNSACPAVSLRVIDVDDGGAKVVTEGAIPATIPMSRNQLGAYIDLVCDATQQALTVVHELVDGQRGVCGSTAPTVPRP